MRRRRRASAFALLAAMTASASLALADTPPASSSSAAPASPADAGEVTGCVETVPKGAARPMISEAFPMKGTSGWAATLAITVRHGKGERVLPAGLDLNGAVEAKKLLKEAGFVIPDQDGGAGAALWVDPNDTGGGKDRTTTRLDLPLVLLPPKPGRNVMELPPLPVAVARANGEIATVCTHAHTIFVEDPTSQTPNAKPKGNPIGMPQREEWTALKKAVLWGGLCLFAGTLIGYFLFRHLTKPKPPPPPPPPRPPWEVALEQLDEVRHAGLLASHRYGEYFDRVSDAVRGYLGARFGFDGLESTTDEILTALKKHGSGFVNLEPIGAGNMLGAPAPGIPIAEIARFLGECDLVKFANLTPTPDQCATSLVSGEKIVRATMPVATARPPVPPAPPSAPRAPSPPSNKHGVSP
jgi:hypothetical protein